MLSILNERGTLTDIIDVTPQFWYAIGYKLRGRFHVRRFVSGRLLAQHEKREGEIIRRAFIRVSNK